MAYLNRHGFLLGVVPDTTGRVFWVAPSSTYSIDGFSYSASDGNDGLSPERALLTLGAASAKCNDNCGDIIMLLPGTHTLTAAVTISAAGVTVMGMPGVETATVRPRTVLTGSAAATLLSITGANSEIAWLHIIPVTAQIGLDIAATGCHIHHCSFDLSTPAANVSTIGAGWGSLGAFAYVHHCVVFCDSAQGPGFSGIYGRSIFEYCTTFQSTGTWAAAWNKSSTADAGTASLFRNNDFLATADAVMAKGIGGSGTSDSQGFCFRNFFSDSVTVAVDFTAAADAEIAENYQAGVGATDGGVLITATT